MDGFAFKRDFRAQLSPPFHPKEFPMNATGISMVDKHMEQLKKRKLSRGSALFSSGKVKSVTYGSRSPPMRSKSGTGSPSLLQKSSSKNLKSTIQMTSLDAAPKHSNSLKKSCSITIQDKDKYKGHNEYESNRLLSPHMEFLNFLEIEQTIKKEQKMAGTYRCTIDSYAP